MKISVEISTAQQLFDVCTYMQHEIPAWGEQILEAGKATLVFHAQEQSVSVAWTLDDRPGAVKVPVSSFPTRKPEIGNLVVCWDGGSVPRFGLYSSNEAGKQYVDVGGGRPVPFENVARIDESEIVPILRKKLVFPTFPFKIAAKTAF